MVALALASGGVTALLALVLGVDLFAVSVTVPSWGYGLIGFPAVMGFSSALLLLNARRRWEQKRKRTELTDLADEDFKRFDEVKRLRQEKDRADFEANLESTFILRRLVFESVSVFDDGEWAFQPGVNVLLGRNGYGKSLILRSLVALLLKDEEKSGILLPQGGHLELTLSRNSEERSIRRERDRFTRSVGKVPVLAIPDSRFIDRSESSIGPSIDSYGSLREDGAYHFLYQVPYGAIIQSLLREICLDYWEHGRKFSLPVFKFIGEVFERLTDDRFEFTSIERVGRTTFEMEVLTEGSDVPIPIQQASQGTLGVLAIFGLIRSYLKVLHPDVNHREVLRMPAIVLIDEIDAHLHPRWLQLLTAVLRDMFPRVQFIVSAHSPLVVAGCLEREVSVLRKYQAGFGVQQLDRDFVGASARELYEEVFDIEELDGALQRHPEWKPLDGKILRRIRQLDRLEQDGELTAADELERANLLRSSRVRRKVAEVLDERHDESVQMLMLQAQIERLRDQISDLGGTPPEVEDDPDVA